MCEFLFEPLHGPIKFRLSEVDWIIVGAETGHRIGRIVPEKSWVQGIIDNAKAENIPVFLKNNLKPIFGEKLIQEFPSGAIGVNEHRH